MFVGYAGVLVGFVGVVVGLGGVVVGFVVVAGFVVLGGGVVGFGGFFVMVTTPAGKERPPGTPMGCGAVRFVCHGVLQCVR
jgi:hypothetical protein